MKIHSVYDPEFQLYGQIVEGMDDAIAQILQVLRETPVPEKGTAYVPEYAPLQELPAAEEVSLHCFGGMPVQLGWCNGHNTQLNCLEYHRDSEFDLGAEEMVLLLAKQSDIRDGALDTAKVKAFWVPAGVMVQVYATTLHYAPCHADPAKGYHCMVALPRGTNSEKPDFAATSWEDRLLWGRNKWLLVHKDAQEAAEGAYAGLTGENIDIADLI